MKLIYAVSLLTSIFTIGCDDTNSTTKKPASPTKASTIKESAAGQTYVSPLGDDAPTYKVAMFSYVPFKMNDEFGKAMGHDVDLIRAVGEEEGFKVQIEEVPFSDIFLGVQEGTKDFAMSGLVIKTERQALMACSKPYSQGRPGYLVTADSKNDSKELLKDKKISILKDSAFHDIMNKQNTAKLVTKPSIFLSVTSIFTGESDAVFAMEPSLLYESANFPDNPTKFVPYSEPLFTGVYANSNKTDLIDKFNKGFDKLVANGRYNEINKKWFGVNSHKIVIK